jgi:hypothetical protein
MAQQAVLAAWDPYIPFATFVMMIGATILLVSQRDLDVDTIDVLYFAILTAGTPTLLHEGGKAAGNAVKKDTSG